VTRALSRRLLKLESHAAPILPRLLLIPYGAWPETEAGWDAIRAAHPSIRLVLPERCPSNAEWQALAGR